MARTITIQRDWRLKIEIFGTDPTATLPGPWLVSDQWSIRFPFDGYNKPRWTGDEEHNGEHALFRGGNFVKKGTLRDLITHVHEYDAEDPAKKMQSDIEAGEDSVFVKKVKEALAEADRMMVIRAQRWDEIEKHLENIKRGLSILIEHDNPDPEDERSGAKFWRRVRDAVMKAERLIPAPKDVSVDGFKLSPIGVDEQLGFSMGRFGHHPDPETDAAVECDRLEGALYEAQVAAGILKSHRKCERCGAAEGVAPPMCSRTGFREPHNFETGKTTMVRYAPANR